jgi:23S rRNA (cytidine1920-2'-O)/16S rRNA (cytidine1409-2'-O)-methyltransferase
MAKVRLDVFLYEKNLVPSRSLAQRLVMAGEVLVNGEKALKPSQKIDEDSKVELIQGPKFVSRGGEKLQAGLMNFGLVDLSGKVCVDVGSSTGGFTDCLLQHGAEKVYSVDVGYGILDWKLRNDSRVIVMERTNARNVEIFPDSIDLVTIDASFISVKILLPVIKNWLHQNSQIIMLIKPQFEAGRKDAAKGAGVIRDHELHKKILEDVLIYAQEIGYSFKGLVQSPLKGPKGNIEFLAWLTLNNNENLEAGEIDISLDDAINTIIENLS